MNNEDPMGGDGPMNNEDPMNDENDESDDSTISIINQLSPSDKEAVRAYAKSMLVNKMEDNLSESFIFTKKQLNKIMENFNDTESKKSNLSNKEKKTTVSKKSPFNSPKFQ
jgi:hypothetical protein